MANIGVAGWFKLPFGGSWPLFCTPGTSILTCSFTVGEDSGMYGFFPYMIMHTLLFYAGTLLAVLLRKAGVQWDKRSFETIWHLGNHFPNLVMCVPMGLMGTAAAYNYWLNDDAEARWGYCHDMYVIEVGTWFGTFLVTDLILGLLHKTLDSMMICHHVIFLFMCLTHFWPPVGPGYSGSVMMAQEISTPFLNIFLLCRGFTNDKSLVTKISFYTFFAIFVTFRVIFNTVVTCDYFAELYREITTGESGFEKSMSWLAIISVLVLGGCFLQLFFFKVLCSKLYLHLTGKKCNKVKTKKNNKKK